MRPLAFAIPGDIRTRTGGYIYERRLLEGLRGQGREVCHLELPASFPDPSPADMARAFALLREVPAGVPLILDGFLSGTLETEGLRDLPSPLCAVVHHPLGLETGLAPERERFLIERETANLRQMQRIVVPSPHTARVLARDFGVPPERLILALPGVGPAAPPRPPAVPPLILSVGILHPRKGHDVLVDALARLADLDWQAVIAGKPVDAACAAELRPRIAASGVAGRISVVGEVDDAALRRLYGAASVFALATRYEGYGMVLAEAMRNGLPVVSCSVGAVPDTVPGEAGVLVPPSDPVAFAEALRTLLSDEDHRRRVAAASARVGAALPDWATTADIVARGIDDLRLP